MDRPRPVRLRHTYELVTTESGGYGAPVLYRDCARLGTGDAERLSVRLLTDLNRAAVYGYKGFAAHAGVVASNGTALAFPADSKGGKSTLTAALTQAGFTYASDESLCINLETHEVEPYPKPISLSVESCRMLGLPEPTDDRENAERPFIASDLGAKTADSPKTLGHVVFAEYGHGKPELSALPPSEVIAGLLRFSFNHYKNPADSFRIATTLAQSAKAWKLIYDDPQEAAEFVKKELG